MRVIILDDEKITKLLLPSVVSGAYVFQYGDEKNILNIEAEGETWVAKSNGSINVCDKDQVVAKVTLRDFEYWNLKIPSLKSDFLMFCMPTLDDTFKKLTLASEKLTIGKDKKNSIQIDVEFLEKKQIVIEKTDGTWKLNVIDDDLFVYLNDKRIKSANLKVGDSIFIYGVVIIWLGTFIQINNPRKIVNVGNAFSVFQDNTVIDNTVFDPVNEEDKDITLYTRDDYFFHKPRLVQTVVEERVMIDPPPDSFEKDEMPWILTMGTSLTMLAFSGITIINLVNNINKGTATTVSIITSLLMCGAMLSGSLVFPTLTRKYNKMKSKQNEKKRISKYTKYLEGKEQEINIIKEKQTQILKQSNLNFMDLYNFACGGTLNIWVRDILDEDFLQVRLGTGNTPSKIKIEAPEEHFTLVEDELKSAVYKVAEHAKMLKDVPVVFNFTDCKLSAIIGMGEVTSDFVNSLMVQLLALHSPNDLKIVGLFNKSNAIVYNYLKYVPHTFSNNKEMRFFANSPSEAKNVLSYLKKIYDERMNSLKGTDGEIKEGDFRKFDTYYLIICDNYMNIRDVQLIDEMLKSDINIGFSLVLIDKSMQRLPKRCDNIISVDGQSGAVIKKNLNDQQLFTPEYSGNMDMRKIGTNLMAIPVMNTDFSTSLPQSISFLEMYNVSKIEQLNILNNWKSNNPVSSLQAPIGVHSDGETFYLDLHEKYHGPHGLIAGSTGSGKSEFIITYVLSMCVNYHPDEVQFILIDYKGGGLAGAFYNDKTGIKVPHIAGVLTDLDTSNMNRAIVSINSELKRREEAFNDAKAITGESTIDIYKYQKYYREGILKKPISHLFIVSDEFAELKSQQPEFMQNIISISRIGRSLGVHLILATQKPSGVVNDQIWSNSRFKVCLKVATRSDSMEMLKRPEAASIKETGRFYLQVGYDELFDIGQSGWSGAKYIPNDRVVKKHDDSITFIDGLGNSYKSVNDMVNVTVSKERGDQLTNTVKYLTDIAAKLNYQTKKLWLDNIPAEIFLGNLKEKYASVHKVTPFAPTPIIGEYDYPQVQAQGLLELDLLSKNTMIWGLNNSGLDEIMKTIIFSTCLEYSPEEVNFYIIDMGAESLRIFNKYPQVGDICTIEDGDKILNMLMIGENEIARRKDMFADYSGDYKTYIDSTHEKLPLIIFAINYFDVFTENFGKIAEALTTIFRDGPKYGIEFILTGGANSLRLRTMEYFQNKLCLQLADKEQYRNLLGAPRGLIPGKFVGRGLASIPQGILEFQTAYITDKQNINDTIKKGADYLNSKYQVRAHNVPVVPKVVSLKSVIDSVRTLDGLIVGYDLSTKQEFNFDMTAEKITPILATDLKQEMNFIYAITEEMKIIKNVKLEIIDVNNYVDYNKLNLVEIYNQDFDRVIYKIYNEVTHPVENMYNVFLFTGISQLKSKLSEESIKLYNSMFTYAEMLPNAFFIFADSYDDYKRLQVESWYSKSINEKHGIWLGTNVGTQIALSFNKLSTEQKRININDVAFATIKGKNYCLKKVIVTEDEEETDDGE